MSKNPGSNEWIAQIDLTSIVTRLLKNAKGPNAGQAMQFRSLLVHTFIAAGRGGEVKFQNFNDLMWNPKLELLDTQWAELKTSGTYALPVMV